MTKFAERIIEGKGGRIRLITGIERGRNVWFYLRLNPATFSEYAKAVKLGRIEDIRRFGESIFCGVGLEPPAIIQQTVKARYEQS